jgi:hypothetical protein
VKSANAFSYFSSAMKLTTAFVFAFIIFTFFSCGHDPEKIYGEWKVEHLTIRCPDRQSFSEYLQEMEEELEGATFQFFNSGRREDFGRFKYRNDWRKCNGEWFFRSDSLIIDDCRITQINMEEYKIMHLSKDKLILSRDVIMYRKNVHTSMTLEKVEE